jgi:hypothetical protein
MFHTVNLLSYSLKKKTISFPLIYLYSPLVIIVIAVQIYCVCTFSSRVLTNTCTVNVKQRRWMSRVHPHFTDSKKSDGLRHDCSLIMKSDIEMGKNCTARIGLDSHRVMKMISTKVKTMEFGQLQISIPTWQRVRSIYPRLNSLRVPSRRLFDSPATRSKRNSNGSSLNSFDEDFIKPTWPAITWNSMKFLFLAKDNSVPCTNAFTDWTDVSALSRRVRRSLLVLPKSCLRCTWLHAVLGQHPHVVRYYSVLWSFSENLQLIGRQHWSWVTEEIFGRRAEQSR